MRMCMKAQVPADGATNISDEEWPARLKQMLDMLKPEAAYFFPQDGMRTMMIFFDMEDVSMMPVISNPMFDDVHAKITFSPAMNLDDLMAGLKKAQNNR
ncbi:hypothetical protein J5V16_08640 [Glycomyces sp. NEAU-S30]|uniref:DUF3303 domain-containing protein n=2 Tax=Glycomyces niveus TaxID=2820287 RepID=A0ABS3U5D1_9ACTN|nr:hypothetical protein [Glycomyces sp. NEAU-S30]